MNDVHFCAVCNNTTTVPVMHAFSFFFVFLAYAWVTNWPIIIYVLFVRLSCNYAVSIRLYLVDVNTAVVIEGLVVRVNWVTTLDKHKTQTALRKRRRRKLPTVHRVV
jgi:hypothetical protein